MNRPVVTVLVKGLGIGGAEKLISEGARYWSRDAFDYRVAYILPWKNQLVDELTELDVPVTCIGSSRGMTPGSMPRLRRLVRAPGPGLIHAHLPWAAILARVVSPKPVVYTEHNLPSAYRYPTRLANRLTYWRNHAVTAVSPAVAARVRRYPGPRVEVVPNGVSVAVSDSSANEVRRELGLTPSQPLVVHVGNIRPGKGHEVLVRTSAALAQTRSDVTVVSVGGEKYPGGLERLKSHVAQQGLNGTLRFIGPRRDALSFIAAADVYVNPADVEGLPVTILEAMALGRPVVATSVGGVASLIQNGANGFLIPPGSPAALAEAITALLDDPATRRRVGAAGAATVAANYNLESMVRAFEDIYRRVLE